MKYQPNNIWTFFKVKPFEIFTKPAEFISIIFGLFTILLAISCSSGSPTDPKFVRKRDADEHYEETYDSEESSGDKRSNSYRASF